MKLKNKEWTNEQWLDFLTVFMAIHVVILPLYIVYVIKEVSHTVGIDGAFLVFGVLISVILLFFYAICLLTFGLLERLPRIVKNILKGDRDGI